jgi:hypothetical protein
VLISYHEYFSHWAELHNIQKRIENPWAKSRVDPESLLQRNIAAGLAETKRLEEEFDRQTGSSLNYRDYERTGSISREFQDCGGLKRGALNAEKANRQD